LACKGAGFDFSFRGETGGGETRIDGRFSDILFPRWRDFYVS
jgi:hypothetical protein